MNTGDIRPLASRYAIATALILPFLFLFLAIVAPNGASTQGAQVNGRNVGEVTFGPNPGSPAGRLVLQDNRTWVQVNASGQQTATFTERNRDAWTVYLFDQARKIDVRVNLHRKQILAKGPGQTRHQVASTVISAKPRGQQQAAQPPQLGQQPPRAGQPPQLGQQQAQVNGRNVGEITFGQNPAAPAGRLIWRSNGTWVEVNASGQPQSTLTEQRRDDWTVYLIDPAGNRNVRFDLRQRQILLQQQGQPQPQAVATIIAARPKTAQQMQQAQQPAQQQPAQQQQAQQPAAPQINANGRNVGEVLYGPTARQATGRYILRPDGTWVDVNAEGFATATYNQRARDDWTVYLVDPKTNVQLNINLFKKQVFQIQPGTKQQQPRWAIVAATQITAKQKQEQAQYQQQQKQQQAAQHAANGRNVGEVTIGPNASKSTGRMIYRGDGTWVEVDVNGNVTHTFNERSRDDWSVHLFDPKRNMLIQLNLFQKSLTFRRPGEKTGKKFATVNASKVKVPEQLKIEADVKKHRAAQHKANGRNVSEVTFGFYVSEPNGRFIWRNDGSWVQVDAKGEVQFVLAERTRDDWTLYLTDSKRRTEYRVNLFQKRVYRVPFGQKKQTQVAVVTASVPFTAEQARQAAQVRKQLQEIARKEKALKDQQLAAKRQQQAMKLTGRNVGEVTMGPNATSPRSRLVRQANGTWIEVDPKGKPKFTFKERARDAWTVYLYDQSRNFELRINMHLKKVMMVPPGQKKQRPFTNVVEWWPTNYTAPKGSAVRSGNVAVTISNTLNKPIRIFNVSDDGKRQTQINEIAPGGLLVQAIRPNSNLWFSDENGWVGGSYRTVDRQRQAVIVPVPDIPKSVAAGGSGSAASASAGSGGGRPLVAGRGSVQIQVINTTASPVTIVEMKPGNKQLEIGPVAASNNVIVKADPGMDIWFLQNGKWLGGNYKVTSAKLQPVALPVVKKGTVVKAGPQLCWKDTYGRGVGFPLNSCAGRRDGKTDMHAGLCYTPCRRGYDGGLTTCVKRGCPSGWTNRPLDCVKPAPYKRAEYPWKLGDRLFSLDGARKRCKRRHGRRCVTANANTIVYERCRKGYKTAPIITNLCTPKCPPGYTDTGAYCFKNTYQRGVGVIPGCKSTQEKDGLLCYPKCRKGYTGVGPVCWNKCPAKLPVNCGASCAASEAACALAVTSMVAEPAMAAASAVLIGVSMGTATGAVAAAQAGKAAGMTAAKMAAGAAAKAAARASAKALFRAKVKAAMKAGTKEAVIDTAVAAAFTGATAGATGSDFDFTALDPTGVAGIVQAYNHPICSDVR